MQWCVSQKGAKSSSSSTNSGANEGNAKSQQATEASPADAVSQVSLLRRWQWLSAWLDAWPVPVSRLAHMNLGLRVRARVLCAPG